MTGSVQVGNPIMIIARAPLAPRFTVVPARVSALDPTGGHYPFAFQAHADPNALWGAHDAAFNLAAEGITWIRGHHPPESPAVRILLAARLLAL